MDTSPHFSYSFSKHDKALELKHTIKFISTNTQKTSTKSRANFIRENLLLINNDSETVDSFMQQFRVSELFEKFPSPLSSGKRQHVAIIRALIPT